MLFFALILFSFLFIWLQRSTRLDLISKRIILIYVTIWGGVILLSILNISNLNHVSDQTYIIMMLQVVGFVNGFMCVRILRNKQSLQLFNIGEKINKFVDAKRFKFFLCAISTYTLSLVVIYFNQLAVMSLSEIRNSYFDFETNIYGVLFGKINFFVLIPFNIIAIPIFAWMLFYKRNWVCLLLGLFLLGYASLGGGRFGYISIFIGILLTICCFFTNKVIKRHIPQLLIFVVVAFSLLAITTASRYSLDINNRNRSEIIDKTVQHITSYATGPIVAFDYALNKHHFRRIGEYQYGKLSGASIDELIYSVLNKIGSPYDRTFKEFAEIKQEEHITIGREQSWNALYTAVLYYYLDFGWIGVFFIPFLFGIIIRYVIKQIYQYNSLFLFFLLSLFFDLIILSVCDFFFVTLNKLLLTVFLYFVGKYKLI